LGHSSIKRYIDTMTIWSPEFKRGASPRYLAIAQALADDIAAGRLRAGARLPTHRDLADRLGVTIGTVSRAYAEAAHRGLVTGEVGRGTFVRALPSERWISAPGAPTTLIDLSVNHPPNTDAEERDVFSRSVTALARRPDFGRLLDYPPDGGAPAHRAAAAAWISRAGVKASPDDVLISTGSQHSMTAIFISLLRPGDVVLTESLTYPGMKALASLLHLRLQGLSMDGDGLRPDALASACRTGTPRALYCVPTLHNPTTAVMTEARRREIAAIARAQGLIVVEDDVHGRLHEGAPPPIATFAPDVTCYLTGTAKSIAPGLRIGYMLMPPPLRPRVAEAIRATTWMAPPLMAEIVSLWITDGTADQIVRRKREEAAARQKIAASILGSYQYQSQPTSYQLWLTLPEPWISETFADESRCRGVAVTPAQTFLVGRNTTTHAVRVCLGAPSSRDTLASGLRILAGLLEEAPRAGMAIV
jgi:DNA-binding transcriptional MocR family regulator